MSLLLDSKGCGGTPGSASCKPPHDHPTSRPTRSLPLRPRAPLPAAPRHPLIRSKRLVRHVGPSLQVPPMTHPPRTHPRPHASAHTSPPPQRTRTCCMRAPIAAARNPCGPTSPDSLPPTPRAVGGRGAEAISSRKRALPPHADSNHRFTAGSRSESAAVPWGGEPTRARCAAAEPARRWQQEQQLQQWARETHRICTVSPFEWERKGRNDAQAAQRSAGSLAKWSTRACGGPWAGIGAGSTPSDAMHNIRKIDPAEIEKAGGGGPGTRAERAKSDLPAPLRHGCKAAPLIGETMEHVIQHVHTEQICAGRPQSLPPQQHRQDQTPASFRPLWYPHPGTSECHSPTAELLISRRCWIPPTGSETE